MVTWELSRGDDFLTMDRRERIDARAQNEGVGEPLAQDELSWIWRTEHRYDTMAGIGDDSFRRG